MMHDGTAYRRSSLEKAFGRLALYRGAVPVRLCRGVLQRIVQAFRLHK